MNNTIVAIIAVVVTALSCFGLHEFDVGLINRRNAANITSITETLHNQCEAQKAITSEAANEFHKDSIGTDNTYNSAIGMLYSKSPISGGSCTALRHDGPASDTRLYYADPKAAQSLLTRMKIAQHQTDQLVECQTYERGRQKLIQSINQGQTP